MIIHYRKYSWGRRKNLSYFFFWLIAGFPGLVYSADWEIEPALAIDEVYTDNVSLAPDGFEDDDFISVITPAISIGRESSNLDFRFDYSLQNTLYAGDSSRNQHNHVLSTDSSAVLIDDRLFLDFSLSRSTQNVTNTGGIGSDNLNVSSDRGAVLNYEITPYWNQGIGSIADLNVSYTRDKISSSKSFGSRADNFAVSLDSGADFSRLLFNLKFENSKINNESFRSSRTRTYNANLKFLLSRKLAITSDIGYDDNEFESSRNSVDDVIWNLGFEWNPSTRTSFSTSYGRRFFGDDLKLFLSHRGRKIETSIRYEQAPSSTRDSFLQQQAFDLTDLFGNTLDDLDNRQISDLNLAVRDQTSEVLIKSKLTVLVSYKLKKHELSLSANYEESEFEVSRETEFIRNLNVDWAWNMFPNTNSFARLTWTKNNFKGNKDDTYLLLQYSVSHKLSATLTGNIGLRYLDRQSNNPLGEYDEGRIFANISKRF